MLVVHGVWAYGAVWLWAEDPALPAHAPARTGRPSRAPRPHPFAVGAAELADALAELPDPAGGLVRKAVDDELTLQLPTVGDGPLASQETGREPPAGKPALAAWRVPALVFEPAAAAAALAVLGGAAEPIRDLLPGATLAYLAVAGRFAADLVTRGRVLPVLVAEDEGYAARWRPVLGAADAQRARELAAAMPPLCRAAGTAQATAGTVLAEMLDAFADAAARTRLQAPLLPPRRGRRPARVELAERTVAALTGPDARVEVGTAQDEAEAQALAAALGAWLASARLPVGPVRTCFRLVEPAETEDPEGPGEDGDRAGTGWRVEFSLQSAEDPSLMLPADDVWAGDGCRLARQRHVSGRGTAGGPRRGGPAVPRARRGAARGGARRGRAGHRGRAAVPARDGPAAGRRGVRRAAAGLGAQGAARAEADHQVNLGGASPSARQSAFGLQDLVDFRYDLAVGDEVLSAAELAELAALKVPLVRVRGQWVELDDRHLKAALKFLEGKRSGHDDRGRGARCIGADGAGRRRAADRGGRRRMARRPAVRPGRPAARADGHPGRLPAASCGRTRSAGSPGCRSSAASASARSWPTTWAWARPSSCWRWSAASARPGSSGPTLLICPMSLVGNWQREAAAVHPGPGGARPPRGRPADGRRAAPRRWPARTW